MANLGRLVSYTKPLQIRPVGYLTQLSDPPAPPAGYWKTTRDLYMQYLIGLGYTTGSISDREFARLKDKTGADGVGETLRDMYELANEEPPAWL